MVHIFTMSWPRLEAPQPFTRAAEKIPAQQETQQQRERLQAAQLRRATASAPAPSTPTPTADAHTIQEPPAEPTTTAAEDAEAAQYKRHLEWFDSVSDEIATAPATPPPAAAEATPKPKRTRKKTAA